MKKPEVPADLPSAGLYGFEEFRLDAAKRRLQRQNGSQIPLTPRVFDTLLFLVHHAGTVLDKERIMEAVWPDSIVEENNLSQNISTLRRVFGETPGSHRFIVTVPGRGYRFVADVQKCDAISLEVAPAAVSNGDYPRSNGADVHLAQDAAPVESVRGETGVARLGRWRVFATIGTLAAGIVIVFVWRSLPHQIVADFGPREKGIAVLPLENLTAGNQDVFFAEGIQDDILTNVGKIKDLKVIARASVMDYRSAGRTGKVREIGQALGVSHVLQGSVRRAGNRVVVNVALIDTRNERQVWSERYERTLVDTISLQGELAVEIARALNATLTFVEEAAIIAAKPTQNPEAYLYYLRAREVEVVCDTPEKAKTAVALFQEAVNLDPNFALARARLSLSASQCYNWEATPEWKAKARAEAEEAARLQPHLGEARLALTHCYLWGDHDPERALGELARAAELLPNSAEVPLTAAFIYKRQNKYRDRLAALHRAEAVDPRNHRVLVFLIHTQLWLRDWPEALHTFDRFAAISSRERGLPLRWIRANHEFRLTGDINVLKKSLAEEAEAQPLARADYLNVARYETAMIERDYTAAAHYLTASPPEVFRNPESLIAMHSKQFHQALLAVASKADGPSTQLALEAARTEIQSRLILPADGLPDETAHAEIALIYACLGRKEEAVRAALRAVELKRTGTIERNSLSAALALVYARTGEQEKALDLVEQLLTVPADLRCGSVYHLTLVDLKWSWLWDPLRSHPRFQKILAAPEPRTVY